MAPEQRNTSKPAFAHARAQGRGQGRKPARQRGDALPPGEGWIWGRHAVLAALANPKRTLLSLHVTRNSAKGLDEAMRALIEPQIEEPSDISARLPDTAVHQGFALKAKALDAEPMQAVLNPTHGLLVVLDQITDPHNVGAIFRSAAAFGARAIIMQDRKSPPLFGTVCKSAVGCAEKVGHVEVTNIADTLKSFRDEGRYVIGLAGEAEMALAAAVQTGADTMGRTTGLVIVLGSEDKGLRPRVADHCDVLARIPMGPKAESLNVSNAAAVALYEASRHDPRINPA
ncbi:tRNA/rRNA methyltransferase SpoU [Glycocaulis alkaliphilus]|uniref:tRNA/rRNA methyltransferase SpoU n=1 Tax=Glycocaulis alkaliphilus TaxID=1434191 RepID=A0A3T0E8C9_9PROT|nr:23S rRNA (guanosine(2251)-2'-O)-methyltransferase RlmB [Glycocaulis alkaliphilus]AZU03388.1 tRNA/rRNA methyltransferase SpoU [Glycocaulis alkaliphilus]